MRMCFKLKENKLIILIRKLLVFNRYFYFIQKTIGNPIYVLMSRLAGAQIGERVSFRGMPIVNLYKGSTIVVGNDCELCSSIYSNSLGVNHPVVLSTIRPGATILIGNNTGISGGVVCASIRIEIGKECLIGANVTIADSDFHPIDPNGRRFKCDPKDIVSLPVIIEDNVFIGTGAIILKGVRIGKNSVIGAGAVVTKSVPANSIMGGNPAKIIRQF